MLNKEQKAGIAILLATIDDNLSITSYRLPQVNNSKVYTIKSNDGEIDISVSNMQLENLSEKLDEIIDYVIETNDFSVEKNDDEYEYIANIFNGYVDKFTEEYEEFFPENSYEEMEGASYKRTEKFLNELSDFRDSANITNNEDKIFAIAYGLCVSVCDILEPMNGEDIEDDMAVCEALQERDIDTLKSEYNLDWCNKKTVPNGKLEKTDLERIFLMMVATIAPELHLEIVGKESLENINAGLFYGVEKDGVPYEVFFHNRSSHEIETEILKIKLYNAITDSLEYPRYTDTRLQEEDIFEKLQEDVKRFGDSYFYDRNFKSICELIDATHNSNLGREKLMMETFTMTVSSLIMDLDNMVNVVSKDDLSPSYLRSIIKQNYEILKRDNKIFPKFAKLVKTIDAFRSVIRSRLESGEMIEKDFLENLETHQIALKNSLKDLVGINNIPSNFEDLVSINEDVLEELIGKELDDMLDEELEREDVEYFDITPDDEYEDDKEF